MVAAFFLPLADTTVISNIWYFLIFSKSLYNPTFHPQAFLPPIRIHLLLPSLFILRPEFFQLPVPHCGLHKSWGDISNSPSTCRAHTRCTAPASNKRLFIWMRHDPPNVLLSSPLPSGGRGGHNHNFTQQLNSVEYICHQRGKPLF